VPKSPKPLASGKTFHCVWLAGALRDAAPFFGSFLVAFSGSHAFVLFIYL
jgi:hypothetical protein